MKKGNKSKKGNESIECTVHIVSANERGDGINANTLNTTSVLIPGGTLTALVRL
jgi:hypothetical protein